jgi:hypothetical protein
MFSGVDTSAIPITDLILVLHQGTVHHLFEVLAVIRPTSAGRIEYLEYWPEIIAQFLAAVKCDPSRFVCVLAPSDNGGYACMVKLLSDEDFDAQFAHAYTIDIEQMRGILGPDQRLAVKSTVHYVSTPNGPVSMMAVYVLRAADVQMSE